LSYRIAYYTAMENNIFPVSRAARMLAERYGSAFRIIARSPADFLNGKRLEQFMVESTSCHMVILHLHGGRESMPGFDRLVTRVKPPRPEGRSFRPLLRGTSAF